MSQTLLKSIAIKNYRSCLNTDVDLHPQLSVLIGPNGSGKTNILQAIMLLKKLAFHDHYLRRFPEARGVSSDIRAVFDLEKRHATLRASVSTHADDSNRDVVEDSAQRWRFMSSDKRKISLEIPLSFPNDYRNRRFRLYPPGARPTRGQLTLWNAKELDPKAAWAFRDLERISQFCAGFRYYGASQFTNPSSCPVSFEIEADGRASGPVHLSGHAKLLYDIYSARKGASAEKYEQFMDIVGPSGLGLISGLSFREILTSSIDHTVSVGGKIEKRPKRKTLVVPQFRIGRQRLSPNQLSEGTFKTLALLFHVIISESTAVLIEEPEVCVHHGLLASILELIKSYSDQKQIILSTHSDYVLDRVSPDNVFRVTNNKARGTEVNHIPKSMTVKEMNALRRYLDTEGNLGEFWREGGLGDRS